MVSRRAILTTGAAALVVTVAGAGVGKTTLFKDLEIARAPWREAGAGFGDVRLNALAYAILAPNPHNRQPWHVRLEEDGVSMTLFCDLNRLLPETDPPNRQITIGLGAFLELYRQALAEQGFAAEVTPFPQGEPYPVLDERPIARVTLRQDTSSQPDPLFEYALARRTVRTNFDPKRPVGDQDLMQLEGLAGLSEGGLWKTTSDPATVTRLKEICRAGWEVEVSTIRTHHESVNLTRIGADEVTANPDGISLAGPMMEGLRVAGIVNREKMNDKTSTAYKSTLSFYNDLIDSAGSFGWLLSPGNSRINQIEAGARWVRVNLAATKLGIAMHPLSQVLQEFPEMSDLYRDIHATLDIAPPARLQGIFRFGYAAYPKAAPRWPLESRLITVGE